MAKAKSTGGGGGAKPSSPAKIVKDSKGNIDPRYSKRIQQEQNKSTGTLAKMKNAVKINKAAQNRRAEDLRSRAAVNDIKRPSTDTNKVKKKKGLKTPAEAVPIILEYSYNEDTGESTPSVVMVPERDVVNLATEDIDAATITNLLFENIGANELVKFVRNDTIEGLNPYYNIISNLSDIRRRFNPSDLISEQITDIDSEGYSINIDNKIPDQEYLDAQGITDYVYIDEATGDLVVHVVNMKDSETVEVQIDTNGTIYEVNN
jgi:hypothetical protein